MFAEIMDHLFQDIRWIQNLASQYILGKTDDPRETSRSTHTNFGDHSA
jgi:hypothetical protein